MAQKISNEIEQQICQLYGDGSGTNEIAKLFNLNRSTVQKILIRNNLKLRKTSPYKKKYNVHYFDEYNDENCYWAGFILADGCIRTDRDAVEIHLQEGDKDHLLKFAKAISFTGELVYDKYSHAYSISVAGKWFPEALKKNFGIEGRKSLTTMFPKQVPLKYYNSLIRGIFDGDGSISTHITQYSNIPQMSIVGTLDLVDNIRHIFYDWGVRLKTKANEIPPIIQCTTTGMGYVALSGKNANLILKKLYENSTDEVRLLRKYNMFMEHTIKYE